jgi:CheY-specific phosphatase CheX
METTELKSMELKPTALKPIMEQAVAEVFEAMCFISSEGEAQDAVVPYPADWICGELDFAGNLSGSFGIAVPPATGATIAANFLGEDEFELSMEQTMEVICELTNMVAGTLLAHLDARSAFTLSPPRPGPSAVHNPGHGRRTACTVTLDEGVIATWLDIPARA